ncbi:MAG: Tll0287-like domain-containing protein [Gelidibacter sp.]
MKNAFLVLVVLFSFFSCNQDKKTDYISIEKKVEIRATPEKTPKITTIDTLSYADRGLQYALNTQAVLGKNLMQAIQENGTLGALSFCNEKAYPLTDSMAVVYNGNIKRVSDKPRNQSNQANLQELEYIETFKQIIANKESPNPIVKDSDTKIDTYYPILTNAMCLQCHGQPNKSIEPSTLRQLTLLYPNDKAIGYNVNQVRGIWSVTFDK